MNYLSNQRTITLSVHLFNQSACYYIFAHLSTNQRAITVFFIVYGTSTHNTRLIAHSSMELKYRY